MKIGFCMLLWTTHVTDAHRAIIEDIKATGYDGIEIPVFEGSPDHYAKLGRMLDEIGLERTAITVIPSLDKNPLGDAAQRQAAVDYLRYCTDCAAALGAPQLAGRCTRRSGIFPAPPRRKRSASAPARCTARRGTMRPGKTCGSSWRRSTASSAISPTR